MAADDLGPWAPLALADLVALMRRFPARWWVTGGLALELYMGRSWRAHGDTDASVLRTDAPLLLAALDGWDISVAAQGELRPWHGTTPRAEINENNLWCRRPGGAWQLDVTVGDGDDEQWVYRRDPSLRRPWDRAVLRSEEGVPYLAPDLQLLFKSTHQRAKDEEDVRVVGPALTDDMRDTLRTYLPPEHPWHARLVP